MITLHEQRALGVAALILAALVIATALLLDARDRRRARRARRCGRPDCTWCAGDHNLKRFVDSIVARSTR